MTPYTTINGEQVQQQQQQKKRKKKEKKEEKRHTLITYIHNTLAYRCIFLVALFH